MTLEDDVVDEFSRHVLMPEIGPAGQARLLETRVVLAGDGLARSLVHDLLARSGLRVVDAAGDVAVVLGRTPDAALPRPAIVGWGDDDLLHAAALTSRPCPACVALPDVSAPTSPLAAQALAALVTTALVLRIVADEGPSNEVRLDLRSGRLETEPLRGPGCGRCADGSRARR